MATKKKRHKRSIFYPIYWCLVILGAAFVILGMRVLWDNMEDYERCMPKYVAQEVEQIFLSHDFATMYEYDDHSICAAEGKDAYIEYMNRLTKGYDITFAEKFSANADEKIYQVKFGANKLATFTLGKSGEQSSFGNDLWMLKDIESSVIRSRKYFITVPSTSTVYVDGQALTAEAVTESGLELTDEYLPEGYERVKWQTYSVERCFKVPHFKVTDKKGRAQAVIPNAKGRLTVQVLYEDAQMRPQVEEEVIQTAKAFAQFTSDDCSTHYMMKFVLPESKAAGYIAAFDGGWFMPHRGINFQNMRTERYVEYDENTFSCDVMFDYEIRYSKTTEVYPTKYTFFFKKSNEEWKMFDFTTIS